MSGYFIFVIAILPYYFLTTKTMPLSYKIRLEIVFYAQHPKGPKMRNTKISKNVKCSFETVKKLFKRYRETGDVQEETIQKRK